MCVVVHNDSIRQIRNSIQSHGRQQRCLEITNVINTVSVAVDQWNDLYSSFVQTLRDNGLRIEVKFTATSNNALPLTENSQIYKSVKESASQLGLNLTEEE